MDRAVDLFTFSFSLSLSLSLSLEQHLTCPLTCLPPPSSPLLADVESVFFALASLLQRLPAQQQSAGASASAGAAADKGTSSSSGSSEVDAVASEIVAKLTDASDSKAAVRVKM